MPKIDPMVEHVARKGASVLKATKNPKNLSQRQRAAMLVVAVGGPIGQDFMDMANAQGLGVTFLQAWNKMVAGKLDWAPEAVVELKTQIEANAKENSE